MLDDEPIDCAGPCLVDAFFGVAEFLMTNFFLPCRYCYSLDSRKLTNKLPVRAATHKTPQPSPTHYEALQRVLSQEERVRMDDFIGTPERLKAFRKSCLERDRNRCVATSVFNVDEADARVTRRGQVQALDDDGNVLTIDEQVDSLEVAHIIPYGLTKADDSCVNEGKKAAIAILNMFDLGVANLLEGVDINRPYNGITLSHRMHEFFGKFKIFFKHLPADDVSTTYPPSTYYIGSFKQPIAAKPLPLVRTLFTHPTIDSPSPRLLAIHNAIAHILHLSAAGDYMDKVLSDMEEGVVRGDGSTQLGLMVQLALSV